MLTQTSKKDEGLEKRFGIKVISNACGALPQTIRMWEKRYQVFSPARSESGVREYSHQDLEKATYLGLLLGKGNPIGSIAHLKLPQLKEMLQPILDQGNLGAQVDTEQVQLESLFKWLSRYKIERLVDELVYLRGKLSAKNFVFLCALPIIRKAGELVEENVLNVTQEHIISTIIRDQLMQISFPQQKEDVGNELALATPDGNLHELAIIMADVLAKSNRVTTRYLGASHPVDSLGQALNALGCRYLVLGVLTTDSWDYQSDIAKYLLALDKILEHEIIVILGGGYAIDLPDFKNISQVNFEGDFKKFDEYLLKEFACRSLL